MRLLLSLAVLTLPIQAGFKKATQGGEHFALLLQDDGTVLGYGDCHFGNLARAECRTVRRPLPIALPEPAVDIAAAKWTSYAVLASGAVYSWGSDEENMLGRAATPGAKRPLREGSPVPAPVPGMPKAVSITALSEAVAVVTESGELWMWGTLYNPRDQGVYSAVPRRIEGLPPLKSFSMNNRGYPGVNHMLALDREGGLWAWGYNHLGQLGDGTKEPSPVPKKLNLPTVVSAAAGGNNAVAVLADGTVRVWGGNDSSTMGNGQNVQSAVASTPVPVAGLRNAAHVSAGIGHVIVLLKDGTMRTWGHDGWGQAGIGTSGGYQMRPAAPKLTGVTAVFASRNVCFAITTGGRLWFWGPGHYLLAGPLNSDKHVPTEITALW